MKSGAEGRVCVLKRQAGKYRKLNRGFGESFQEAEEVRGRECFSGEDTSTSGCNKSLLSLEPDSVEQTGIGQGFGCCP